MLLDYAFITAGVDYCRLSVSLSLCVCVCAHTCMYMDFESLLFLLSQPQEPLSSLKSMAERAAQGSGLEGELSALHLTGGEYTIHLHTLVSSGPYGFCFPDMTENLTAFACRSEFPHKHGPAVNIHF